jgi:hypothetical protein
MQFLNFPFLKVLAISTFSVLPDVCRINSVLYLIAESSVHLTLELHTLETKTQSSRSIIGCSTQTYFQIRNLEQ